MGEEGGMIWENSSETYALQYVKHNQCDFGVWSRAPEASALWPPRGIGVEWGGESRYRGQIHIDVLQKPSPYCKVIILQLK